MVVDVQIDCSSLPELLWDNLDSTSSFFDPCSIYDAKSLFSASVAMYTDDSSGTVSTCFSARLAR